MKKEFAVISVAGMYRTGKSYLLNQMLLNRSKGFSVGPTVNPCTKGLWMWGKPIMGLDSQGSSKIPILLIDTEGFGAFDEDQNHDIKIFTLAVLLSSFFIYNSMGSIDENAIQSLSFVINLSKNIQLKGKYENDPEELSALFPSFLWLVRDFSLQLVDDDGDTITPKEYLEKVLDTSKSTYDIDDKANIRKLIKSYFKDRDCHTMVRPITDESKLQDLASITTDKLRPDFVEGIIQLRKKIASKIKPKMLQKKALTGDMFISMIKSYIDAINNGAVPNIENTWSSMCKVECEKAFELADKIYDDHLRENLKDIGTVNSTEFIMEVHRVAKENALDHFKKKALGENNEDFIKKLKNNFKEKVKYYENQANEANKNEMYKKLKQFYSYFENKIYNPKSADDEVTIQKVEEELKRMEYKINERFGDFSLKNEIFIEFKANVFVLIGSYLKQNNELLVQQSSNEKEEMQRKFNLELEEIRNSNMKEAMKKNSVIEKLRSDLLEQKENYSNLSHQLASVQKDLDIMQKSNTDKHLRQKDENDRKLGELQKTLILQDEKVRDADRKIMQVENEKSKEIALLEQKNQHLTKLLEESKKTGADSGSELKNQIKEATNALKESSLKYEAKIKQLTQSIDQYKEQLVDHEANYKKCETILESEREKNSDLEKKIKFDKDESDLKIENLKKKLDQERAKMQEEFQLKEKDIIFNLNKLKITLEENDIKYKSNEEDLRNQLAAMKRENSMLLQNNGFLEDKCKDLQHQLEEQKKNHDEIVARLESKTFSMIGNDEFNNKLEEIKSIYEKDKQQNEETFDNYKKTLQKQLEQLNETKNELDIRKSAEIDEKSNKIIDLQGQIEKLTREVKNLTNEKKTLSDQLHDVYDEMNEKEKEHHKNHEKNLEDKDLNWQKERDELHQKSEDTIKKLKMIYETEKIRLEEKLKEEKNKSDKKLKQNTNDYEEKIREIQEEAANEYAALEEEYKILEQNNNNYISQAENEINLLTHKVETLEKNNKDLKDQMTQAQIAAKQANDLINEKYEKERKEMHEKLEIITSEFNTKEKEILLLKSDKERLEGTLKDKEEYISQLRKELEEDKKELNAKLEEYNRKYHEGHDKFLTEKMEFTKEVAILKQQIEFSKKRCDELKEQVETNQVRYDEKLCIFLI